MKDNHNYTLGDVLKIDNYLFELASYEVSKGLMKVPSTVEDVVELNPKMQKQFVYFKSLIRTGECTLEELEGLVVKRHGSYYSPDRNLTFSEAMSKILEEPEPYQDIEEDDLIYGKEGDDDDFLKMIALSMKRSIKNMDDKLLEIAEEELNKDKDEIKGEE